VTGQVGQKENRAEEELLNPVGAMIIAADCEVVGLD
jgi:hypothetical protein